VLLLICNQQVGGSIPLTGLQKPAVLQKNFGPNLGLNPRLNASQKQA
jgi:hypothetical protein